MASNYLPSIGFMVVHAELAALRDALDRLKRKARKTKRIIKVRHGGNKGGADILGDILGGSVYLDYGGSSKMDADNPFNPTMDQPVGTNPNAKP